MTAQDRQRWDSTYTDRPPLNPDDIGPPEPFADFLHEFPTTGTALDIACGRGATSVWLARRGLDVFGVDVSPVAVEQARQLGRHDGRCRFEVADLDDGLPPGPRVDVITCLRFRDARLDAALIDRLNPGGLLALTARSTGTYGARPDELTAAFRTLDLITVGAGDGFTWLLARKP